MKPPFGQMKPGQMINLAQAMPEAVGNGWLASTTELILAEWPGSGSFLERLREAIWHTPMKVIYALQPALITRLGGTVTGPDAGDKAASRAKKKMREFLAKNFNIAEG